MTRRLPECDAVIVLDLDDTLYLERTYVESGLRAVGVWFEGQYGRSGLSAEMIDHFRAGARQRIFDRSLEDAGFAASPQLIGQMLQVYRQHRPSIRLADDAVRLFDRRPSNIGCAIITDGFLDAQKRKLRALDLHVRGVHLAVCTDRWGRQFWKPSCRAFEHVQAFFGVDGASLVYVADNPAKDFLAPKALGWQTIRIEREDRLHVMGMIAEPADRTITSLDEIDFRRSR